MNMQRSASYSVWSFLTGLVVVGVCGAALSATSAHAQEAMSVSVTPPLVQLTIGPGESWASSLKEAEIDQAANFAGE